MRLLKYKDKVFMYIILNSHIAANKNLGLKETIQANSRLSIVREMAQCHSYR